MNSARCSAPRATIGKLEFIISVRRGWCWWRATPHSCCVGVVVGDTCLCVVSVVGGQFADGHKALYFINCAGYTQCDVITSIEYGITTGPLFT